MSIFKDLKEAANIAHFRGNVSMEQACDRLNVLIGEALREFGRELTTERLQTLIALWTQAEIVLKRATEPGPPKPERVA